MADKEKDKKGDAPGGEAKGDAAKPAKKGLPIKTIGVVAGIMVLEAVAVVMVFGMFGGPKASHAETDPHALVEDDSNKTQEVVLVEDKFQNLTTGRVWVWDISVYVQVKNKHAERVQEVLESRAAEVKEGVGQIVSRAQHSHLKEPERQTINRQLSVYLEKVIGMDEEGKPLIERVLIPRCRGYPADF